MDIKKSAVVLNGFIHDFATGYWLSAIISLYYLHGFQGKYPAAADLLNVMERFFFWNTIGAVAVILATGAGRTYTYVGNIFGESTEQTRRRMLIIKHIILVAVFGAGGWWAYGVTFH